MTDIKMIVKASFVKKEDPGAFAKKVAYNNRLNNNDPISKTFKQMTGGFKRKVAYNNSTLNEGKKQNHSEYFRDSNLSSEIITNEGILNFKSDELSSFLERFDKADVMGMSIVSFSHETSAKIKKLNLSERELYEYFKNPLEKYLRANNLDPSNMLWNFAFHSDKEHFHFHFDYVEIKPTREQFKMSQISLKNLKKELIGIIEPHLVNDLNAMENALNISKDVYRRKASEIKGINLESEVYKKAMVLLKEEALDNGLKPFYKSIKSPELKEFIKRHATNELAISEEYINKIQEYRKYSNSVFGEKLKNLYREDIEQLEQRAANSLYRDLKNEYFLSLKRPSQEDIIANKKIFENNLQNVHKFGKYQKSNRSLHIPNKKLKSKALRELEEIQQELYGI